MTESSSNGMIARCQGILLKPREEWARIDTEPASVGGLMTRWVAPLAAIGPVAGMIAGLGFGYSAFGVTYRPSVTAAVTGAVIGYLVALVAIFLLAKVIDFLAPRFDGTANSVQAMKVAAYSATASYLAAVFQAVPALSILGILGLYSLYLLYLGLPRLMKAPQDKAMSYTIVTVIAAAILFLIVGAVTAALTAMVVPRTVTLGSSTGGTVSGTVNIPGVGSVDMSKVQEAAKKIETAGDRAKSATPVDRQALAGLLPASAAGMTRTAIESSSASAGGFGGSQAEARYETGDQRARLKIVDLASAGAFAAMASAFKIETSRESDDGYQKSGMIDGRYTMEKWNRRGNGTYGLLIGDRFLIEADGDASDIGVLKSLVGAVDLARLEALAG